MDLFAALGTAAIVSIVIVIAGVALALLVVILIIREGVSQGLRSHQLWMEKTHRIAAPTPFGAITPPGRQF